jgi:hypothetical protein
LRRPLLTVITALLLLPAAAQAQSGMPADIRSVTAVAPVRDDNGKRAMEVYRALLPKGMEAADQPSVGVWLADLTAGRNVDGRPYDHGLHWVEGAIALRVKRGAEEGWYPVHYPVTAEFWFHAGRAVGLPKRRANASFTRTKVAGGWRAQATPSAIGGGPSIDMAFTPSGQATERTTEIAGLPLQQMFVLNSPFEGPDIERVQYSVTKPYDAQRLDPVGAPPYSGKLEPVAGDVRLQLRTNLDEINEDLPGLPEGASLGDVIDPDQVVPGAYLYNAVGLGSSNAVVGQGGYERPRANGKASPLPAGADPGENAKLGISALDTINVVLEPASQQRYEGLFTGPIEPLPAATDETSPERPLIDFKLHSVGGTMEMWTDLRGRFCGDTGWYNNATAVDNAALYAVSRGTGYPKWQADKIALRVAPDGESAVGTVTQLGGTITKLEWRKDDQAVKAALKDEPWREHWLQGRGFSYGGDVWSFEGAGDAGPFVKSVHTEYRRDVEQRFDSRVGMVKVTVTEPLDPLLTHGDWPSLVPETVEVPGMLESWRGQADFYGTSMRCGLEGSTATSLPKGVLPEPPAALRR